MDLNDMARRAWQTAQDKGLHDALDTMAPLGAREQALLSMVPVFLRLLDVTQEIKRRGVSPEQWDNELCASCATAEEAFAAFVSGLHRLSMHDLSIEPVYDHDKVAATTIRLLLMQTEIAEALEILQDPHMTAHDHHQALAHEIADVFVRGADLAHGRGIDLDATVAEVMDNNERRPYGYGTPLEQVPATTAIPQFSARPDAWALPNETLLGFVPIPEGPFLMGSNEDDPCAYDNEQPQHRVTLSHYYMARYPVTVAQFEAFVEANGYTPSDPRSLQGLSTHPVVCVNWHDVIAYCTWLTERLRIWEGTPPPLATLIRDHGWQVKLPSEAEWEKAARGTTGLIYPWGNTFEATRANTFDSGIRTTTPVEAFPAGASPYGLMDMSGNVWEWTRSLWEFPYPYNRYTATNHRVVRGGAFWDDHQFARCAFRYYYVARFVLSVIGFRVVLVPPPL